AEVRAVPRPAPVQRPRRARGRPSGAQEGACSSQGDRLASVPGRDREDGKARRERVQNVPDSFFDAFTDSGKNAIVKVCVKAALTGAACPGAMKVTVPWTYHPAGAR